MYTYRPSSTTTSPLRKLQLVVAPQSPGSQYLFLGIAVGVLLVGWFVIGRVSAAVYARHTTNLPTAEAMVYPTYSQKVAQETDVKKLTTVGQKLMEKSMPAYAKLNFKKAAELDPNRQDAAYAWAYALLAQKAESLTVADLEEAKQALDQAEKVDPLSERVIKLKLAVAELQKDQPAITQAKARLELIQTK